MATGEHCCSQGTPEINRREVLVSPSPVVYCALIFRGGFPPIRGFWPLVARNTCTKRHHDCNRAQICSCSSQLSLPVMNTNLEQLALPSVQNLTCFCLSES